MKPISLSCKNIWITGASKGIGKSTAEKLIDTEASLILSASREDSFKDSKFNNQKNIKLLPFDMRSISEVEGTIKANELLLNNVDILINNAGIGIFKPFTETGIEDLNNMNAVNYITPYLTMQAVLSGMMERKFGIIINIISVVAVKTFTNSSVYAATKSALLAMDRSLREEVRSAGVKIIDILPGATSTDIWNPKVREKHSERMMTSENVADTILNVIDLSLNNKLMIEEIIIRPQGGDL